MLKSKVGYSTLTDSFEAGKEAMEMAIAGLNGKIAFMFSSVAYDQEKLMEGVKSVSETVPVVGCTSSASIIVPDGILNNETGYVGIMILDDPDMEVVSMCSERGESPRETGRKVAISLMEKANMDFAPDYFFMSANPAEEEAYIKGIQDVIGRVPCFGGSAADNDVSGKWSLFGDETIVNDGVAVAFIYTDKKVSNVYTGAYKETKDMGVITKVKNNRVLMEIDGEPALEKYAKWRGMKTDELMDNNLLVATILSPLGVKDRLGSLTAIRHPMVGNKDLSMNIGANLAEGTAVIRMEATVDELIDSVGKTLKETKKGLDDPACYLLVHCGGRALGIGDRLNEVYEAIKKEVKDVPFIVAFTFGEYGSGDDQADTTGGLMLSFTGFDK